MSASVNAGENILTSRARCRARWNRARYARRIQSGPHPVRQELDATAGALLVLFCAIWGLSQIAVKVASAGISPALQAGLRSIGSAALAVGWARWRGVPLLVRDETFGPGIAAGLLFAAEFLLLFWGLTFTTASRSIVFLYTAPFAMAIGAHFLVPGDRLTRARSLGLAVAFTGVLVVFADGLGQPSHRQLIGDLLCFGAAIAWAATTILIKVSRLKQSSPERVLLYQLAVSAVVLPAASAVTGETGFHGVTPLVVASLAYQIVIVAFASYAGWFWLVARYPTSRLAAFTFLTPVFGVAFGGLLLGESLGPGLLVACALIAAGIYLVNRRPTQISSSSLRRDVK